MPLARISGLSLLEVLVALAISSLAAAALAAAAGRTLDALRLGAARRTTVLALLDARRRAYLTHRASEVSARIGSDTFRVRSPAGDQAYRLPPGVLVSGLPARGYVRFHASGLADNATIVLAGGAAEVRVVINQRGRIR